MAYYQNILETIGHTPLVKLNRVTAELPCTVLAKVEFFNPGHSIKDRMAVKMIEDAEKAGLLKPGGTIIEGTSGNTGMGLAMAAIVKGYKCIFTITDKQSKEKIDILKALGPKLLFVPPMLNPRILAPTIRLPGVWPEKSPIAFISISITIFPIVRLIMKQQVRKYGSKRKGKLPIWW